MFQTLSLVMEGLMYIPFLAALPEVKLPEREVNHRPPFTAEVKNERCYTSTPPIRLHGMDRKNVTFTLLLRHDYLGKS